MNYSRRKFIQIGSLASLGAILTPSFTGCTKEKVNEFKRTNKTIQKITGKNLVEIRDWYSNQLFNRFIPNMDKYIVDHKYGGFMCNADIETGKIQSTHKRAWYEGRGIWVYSFLYNNFIKEEKILDVAKRSIDFIMKHEPDKGSFWASSYTQEGEILTDAGDANLSIANEGDIYGGLFIAEGLVEYSKATGDQQLFEKAKKILLDSMQMYESPQYFYRISYYSEDVPTLYGVRVLGHWMVLLRIATQMLHLRENDVDIKKIADKCIDAIMNHHLNKDYKLLNEALNHDFTLPDSPFNQLAYVGHGLETLWMVMDEAIRRNDKKIFEQSYDLFKRHVIVAQDTVYGGYLRSLDHVDNFTFKTNKVLWLQEEVLVGTLFSILHHEDEWARNCFAETFNYVQENFIREGCKFWIPGGDRKMDVYDKNRVENYHHPRHLMLNLLMLNQMINKK